VTQGKIRGQGGKLSKLRDGTSRILMHKGGAKILARVEPLRIEALDLAVFADGGDEVVFLIVSKTRL